MDKPRWCGSRSPRSSSLWGSTPPKQSFSKGQRALFPRRSRYFRFLQLFKPRGGAARPPGTCHRPYAFYGGDTLGRSRLLRGALSGVATSTCGRATCKDDGAGLEPRSRLRSTPRGDRTLRYSAALGATHPTRHDDLRTRAYRKTCVSQHYFGNCSVSTAGGFCLPCKRANREDWGRCYGSRPSFSSPFLLLPDF